MTGSGDDGRRHDAVRLAHDVGKYVARVARNVPDGGPMPEGLLPLLLKDLYALPGGGRASSRLTELSARLADEPDVARAARLLEEVDALEARVRAADDEACLRACALARDVETLLRGVAASVARRIAE